MNDWTARAAPAQPPPPPPVPPQSSSGRNSPANLSPPDDAAGAVARVASEFRALERLRDAGYGGSISSSSSTDPAPGMYLRQIPTGTEVIDVEAEVLEGLEVVEVD